ncbi:MAG: tRNA pseudouridine38-40 synthase [Crocinitomicaceae bacterium]|jgi:tRNA pseudouridine38-40 synthase
MQRYFIELSYNGRDFHGWQIQPNAITVQEVVEDRLSKYHSNSPIKVVGCGRTDAGVHAKHYVLHVELPEIEDVDLISTKLNRMLPASISIHTIYAVDAEKHARFDASARTYRYYIHQQKDPFSEEQSWFVPHLLDFEAMNDAAKNLIGKQDFTSFSKLHTDVGTNICTVKEAKWVRIDEHKAYFEITADRFLRNMVRATVGTLMDVGSGKTTSSSIKDILKAKDRQAASVSVPAHALYLWKVAYP